MLSKKVVLIEPVLAHYRKDVFSNFYMSNELKFEIIAGKDYQGIKSVEGSQGILLDHFSFKLLNHRFYFLKGSIRSILSQKPETIICTGVDFHLIHTIFIFFIFRIILRKKFYWWSHATYGNQGKFGILLRKIIYKYSSGIFSYNMQGKENLLSMGIEDSRIKVVNNSINKEDYGYLNYDIYSRKRNDTFTLLYSGRVTEAKKVDLLIKALSIIKEKSLFDFKCIVVGDGDSDHIIHLVNKLKLSDNIDFVGAKYGIEAHSYFLNADLFVYPGGIGLSIVHAMSYGLPVITTNKMLLHGPEIELFQKRVTGDLYQDNSADDLANKIMEWKNKLSQSKEVYIKNCIQRIESIEYLPDVMSDKVINFLKENN